MSKKKAKIIKVPFPKKVIRFVGGPTPSLKLKTNPSGKSIDSGAATPILDRLELDMSNLRMDDALIVPNSGLAKDSQDGRRLPSARLVKGDSFSLDVTDPGFQNGAIKEVEIILYFRIQATCTIETYYQSQSGMKLGNTADFELEDKPFWKEYRFRVSDAHFGAEQDVDLRIQVEGAVPLLGMVVIAAPVREIP